MNDAVEFIKSLGINTDDAQENSDGTVTITLEDFDDFTYVYSKLDDSEELDICDEETNFTGVNGFVLFEGDDYHISLIADIDADEYRLVAEENA